MTRMEYQTSSAGREGRSIYIVSFEGLGRDLCVCVCVGGSGCYGLIGLKIVQ